MTRRQVQKRPPEVSFGGRVLFLADDADLIRRQLHEGLDLDLTPELKAGLRDQISTDEITPAYICFFYDETLGEFPYLGLEVRSGGAGGRRTDGRAAAGGTEAPIERGSVRNAGFICSVAGKRRGKGSSREQSPYAELMAGIKVVVSESIERIYNENCQNLGILTTTDFGLIERIRSGEPIPLSEFTAGTDDITRQIIEYGGLFEFNMARMGGQVTLPSPRALADPPAGDAGPRPMTLGEKIFARKWVVDASSDHVGTDWTEPGEAGFFRADIRFSHEYVTPMAAIFFEQKLGADARVLDPDSILFFRDHLTFLHKVMSQ
ncbi:MAG: hypothetical protein F4Z31_17635, partial [Gemmatimonadetes bacterium]|nr:hypothetical protein [Gemmatimonadota bacterium]